jgi:hypothetical protein
MIPEIIKDKFDSYRKWFGTIIVKEFMNLPHKHQEKFLHLAEKFINDCRKVYTEHNKILEKTIIISVLDIHQDDHNKLLTGKIEGSFNQIKIIVPKSFKTKKGNKIRHIMYSLDKEIWHSSKEQLITGRS